MKDLSISSKRSGAGKGVLFATAHMGAWELSAFAHALMAEPMHVVVRPLDNPLIDAEVEAPCRRPGIPDPKRKMRPAPSFGLCSETKPSAC